MKCLLVAGCLLNVLFSIADGSGQSCIDLDPQGCLDMAKQNPNMCMDHDLATAVCPKHCHRCPITCYNCNSPSMDVRGCNTITCNSNEMCMVNELHLMMAKEPTYDLRCASKSFCDARQSTNLKCCSDDLCNTPDLIPHVTSTTPSPTSPTSPSPDSYRYEYMGCFVDIESRILSEVFEWSNELTTKKCFQICAGHGKKFMLTEAAIQCFCGDDLKPTEKRPDVECDSPCGGNRTEMCGAGWKSSVYRILHRNATTVI